MCAGYGTIHATGPRADPGGTVSRGWVRNLALLPGFLSCFGMRSFWFRDLKHECWNKEGLVPEGLLLRKRLVFLISALCDNFRLQSTCCSSAVLTRAAEKRCTSEQMLPECVLLAAAAAHGCSSFTGLWRGCYPTLRRGFLGGGFKTGKAFRISRTRSIVWIVRSRNTFFSMKEQGWNLGCVFE